MCGGVKYGYQGKAVTAYFPSPTAALPVVVRGGWARLESVRDGKWRRYAPLPVRIEVEAFMEKDGAGLSHWYELPSGQWIRGLIAYTGDESRVYVVTVVPEDPAHRAVHGRWPRIVSLGDCPGP